MNPEQTTSERTLELDVRGVFRETAAFYEKNFFRFWTLALLILIPYWILYNLLDVAGLGNLSLLIDPFSGALLTGGSVKIVQTARADGTADLPIGNVFRAILPKLFWLAIMITLIETLIGFGLVFLIIPGAILGLMWIVAVPVMVIEDRGVFNSMSRSSELTRGNRTKIFWIGLPLISVLIILTAIELFVDLDAISPFITDAWRTLSDGLIDPLGAVLVSVLYFRLRRLKPTP